MELVLFARQGCCLCEGLAEKLMALEPAPALRVIDIDQDPELQARYGLEVPVLAVVDPAGVQPLPRVPPRLMGERLLQWLSQHSATLG
jgi:hypothetical protein